jgi:nucleoside-diphosphate kinase
MALELDKLSLRVEWLDAQASLKRYYILSYFVNPKAPNDIELVDVKSRRTFLKRNACPGVAIEDLFVGAKVRGVGGGGVGR